MVLNIAIHVILRALSYVFVMFQFFLLKGYVTLTKLYPIPFAIRADINIQKKHQPVHLTNFTKCTNYYCFRYLPKVTQ